MRVLVFGATGGTGRELVSQALERGHEVAAFVRTPSKLTLADPRLRLVRGSVDDAPAVRGAVPGNDAVLTALGTRTLGPTTLLSEALRVFLETMEAHGVRRILWQSSLGVGDTCGRLGPLYNWLLVPVFLRQIFADKERQEAILKASRLDWTIVQPATLTNGPRTGSYRAGPDAFTGRLFPRISRADVAHFMLEALEGSRWVRQAVPLCYGGKPKSS